MTTRPSPEHRLVASMQRRYPAFFQEDPPCAEGNPYCEIQRDANGRPTWANGRPYHLTPRSMQLRGEAYARWWQSYPPMDKLPKRLPSELRYVLGGDLGRESKDGYLLHYGFLLTTAQLTACLEKHNLEPRHGRGGEPLAIMYEVAKRTDYEFEGTILSKEIPVPVTDAESDEDACAWIISLYSNGKIGVGQGKHRYTAEEEKKVTNILLDLLKGFTHFPQEKPMWFWSYIHGPNFDTLKNWEKWDVAGL